MNDQNLEHIDQTFSNSNLSKPNDFPTQNLESYINNPRYPDLNVDTKREGQNDYLEVTFRDHYELDPQKQEDYSVDDTDFEAQRKRSNSPLLSNAQKQGKEEFIKRLSGGENGYQSKTTNDSICLPGTNGDVNIFMTENPLQVTGKNETPLHGFGADNSRNIKNNYLDPNKLTTAYETKDPHVWDPRGGHLKFLGPHEMQTGMYQESSTTLALAADEGKEHEQSVYPMEEEEKYDSVVFSPAHQSEEQINDHSISPNSQISHLNSVKDTDLAKIYELYNELYLAIFLFGLILLGMLMQIIHFSIFFAFIMLIQLRNLHDKIKKLRATPKFEGLNRRQCILAIVEVVLAIIFEVYTIINIAIGYKAWLSPLCAICSLYALIYCFFEGNFTLHSKFIWILIRCFGWMQILLVCFKTDSLILWEWTGVFCIYWIFCFLLCFYCLGLLISLVCLCVLLIFKKVHPSQFIGVFWLVLLLVGNFGCFTGVIYGFTIYSANSHKRKPMVFSLLGSMFLQLVLLIYSSFFRIHLYRFIYHLLTPAPPPRKSKQKPQATYEKVEDKRQFPTILFMFSNTYFIPVENLFQSAVFESLAETKAANQKAKYNSRHRMQDKTDPNKSKVKKEVTFNTTQILPKDQSNMPSKATVNTLTQLIDIAPLEKLNGGMKVNLTNNHLGRSNLELFLFNHSQNSNTNLEPIANQKEMISHNILPMTHDINSNREAPMLIDPVLTENMRPVLSEGDAEFVDTQKGGIKALFASAQNQMGNNQTRNEKDSEECLICFDNKADTVIMNCGHGGLCIECAMKHWDKSTECYICRGEIFQILQIEQSITKHKNITKVISAYKRVLIQNINVKPQGSRYDDYDAENSGDRAE